MDVEDKNENKDQAFQLAALMPYLDRGLFVRERPEERFSTLLGKFLQGVEIDGRDSLLKKVEKVQRGIDIHQLIEGKTTGYHDAQGRLTKVFADPLEVDQVLNADSDDIRISKAQARGLGIFEPKAVAATRCPGEHAKRRVQNDETLERFAPTKERVWVNHVRAVLASFYPRAGTVTWGDIDGIAKSVASRVVLGRDDQTIMSELEDRMRVANAVAVLKRRSEIFGEAPEGFVETLIASMPASVGDRYRAAQQLSSAGDVFGDAPSDAVVPDRLIERIISSFDDAPAESLISSIDLRMNESRRVAANQVVHWLFAARVTVSVLTIYTLALLAASQPKRDKLVRELERMGGLAAADDRLVSPVDSLPFLEHCVFEAGRLFPVVPVTFRCVKKAPKELHERVNDGEQILIHNAVNNRRKCFVGCSPNVFDPSRWRQRKGGELPQVDRSTYAATMFANGHRTCPGRELGLTLTQAILAELLLKFDFNAVSHNDSRMAPMDTSNVPGAFDQFGIVLTATSYR